MGGRVSAFWSDPMTLIGHDTQVTAFLNGWKSGRMHHAWLIAGPKGIGKALFAAQASEFILSGGAGDRFEAIPNSQARALLAAGSHPDFRKLERTENDRGKLRAEIVVEQIRAMQPLLQGKPSISDWRVIIVDAADELNRNASNAFLKNLEEPPEKTIFFLVSHAPNRLLPTIRSRCRVLRFRPLSDDDTRAVLGEEIDAASPAELDALTMIASGLPGRAIGFAGLEIEKLQNDLKGLVSAHSPGEANMRALALAKSLTTKAGAARYEAFVELLPGFIADEARGRSGASLAHALGLWEKAQSLAAEALPLAHDPQAVAYELAGLVGELGRH